MSSPGARDDGFGLLDLLGVVPGLFAACVVVGMKVAMAFGLGVTPAAVVGVGVFGGVSAMLAGRPSTWRLGRPGFGEIFVVAVACAVLVGLWVRAADRSLLWPHVFGVDQAHHIGIATYISDHDAPLAASPDLGGLAGYPSGAHLLVVALARATGLNLVSAVWLTAVLACAIQVFSISWLASRAVRSGRWLAASASIAVWIMGWRYGVAMVTDNFWLSHVVSISMTLACVGLIGRTRRAPLLVILPAVYWTYPQLSPIAVAAALAVWGPTLLGLFRRSAVFRIVSLCALGVGALAVYVKFGTADALLTAITGIGEGTIPRVTVAATGGWVVVALTTLGVVLTVNGLRSATTTVTSRSCAGAVLGCAAIAVGLVTMRRFGVPITRYRVVKNLYSAFPFLCVTAGIGVSWLSRKVEGWGVLLARSGVVGACALSLGLLARPEAMRRTSVQLVDRDAYELTRSVFRDVDPNTVGFAGDGLSPYTLWIAGGGKAFPADIPKSLNPRAAMFDAFPEGTPGIQYLIADRTAASEYVGKPGVALVREHGTALLLRRTG